MSIAVGPGQRNITNTLEHPEAVVMVGLSWSFFHVTLWLTSSLFASGHFCASISAGILPFSNRAICPQRVQRTPTTSPFSVTLCSNWCFAIPPV